ncbi:sensor domain-containing protein [Roseobacter sp. CCS2]|uniref:sensor domain-containing protein n=1 Tax=Roseobacter sp. CCS2 TaxID=391593 RepID=UPI0000F3E085|nr:GGDEF and EAL domain-containing protein [Roseobacter sp. CCS2]EBA12182.1 putative sensory box/GGDEF family protein [Roseobacter sp. CCS2]
MANLDSNNFRKLEDFAEIASDWFWESDAEHRMSYLSGRIESVLKIKIADIMGASRAKLPGVLSSSGLWKAHFADLEARRPFKNFEYSFIRPTDNQELWLRVSGKPIFDAAGTFKGYRGIGHDVTEERETVQRLIASNAALAERNKEMSEVRRELERRVNEDSLTGLLNRRAFERDTQEALGVAGNVIVLLHIDLDRFKWVNDTLGHPAGDIVLKTAADRLRRIASGIGPVYRMGGDEFLIVLADNAEIETARWMADAILDVMEKPIAVDRQVTSVSASIGIASGISGKTSLQQLVADADIALYEAKKTGRGCTRELTPEMLGLIAARRKLASEISAAIRNDEVIPFFQPQIHDDTNMIIGAEALARWQHPELGLLDPDAFLDVAAEVGVVADIDRCMMHKALYFVDRAKGVGLYLKSVSINLSTGRLRDPNLVDDVRECWLNRDCQLKFELLETISFDELLREPVVIENLKHLRAMGVQIEADDFGSGHASITSLLEVRPDRIKIDRHLVQAAINDPVQRKVVSAILEIARALEIEALAEGVETKTDVAILRDLGCELFQGFVYAKPMPAGAFLDYLRDQQAAYQTQTADPKGLPKSA